MGGQPRSARRFRAVGNTSLLVLQGALARELLIAHVVLLVDRAHEQIAQEADQEQPHHDVERAVVDERLGDATVELGFAQLGDDGRAHHAGD